MKVIGAKRWQGENAYEMRCTDHVDSVNFDTPVYDTQELDCTYCGQAWKGQAEPAPVTRKARHTDTPGPVMVYWPMSKIRRSMMFWGLHMDSVTRYGIVPPLTEAEEAEYRQYISDGLADTDGYYAPMSRTAWKGLHYPNARITVRDAAEYGRMLRSGPVTPTYGAGV